MLHLLRIRILLTLLLASVCLAHFTNGASAQWQHLAQFQNQISSVYFPKGNCGLPTTGFVGTYAQGIYKTTDGGKTFRQVLVPTISSNYISAFAFKDANTGWASVCDLAAADVQHALCKTTDGGDTWTLLPGSGCYSNVYYVPATARLIVSAWSGYGAYSTDDGTSWTKLSNLTIGTLNPQNTGVAFISSTNGLITSLAAWPNLVTTDGGLTWQETTTTDEVYQPLALPCQSTFYTAGEGSHQVKRSTDGGLTWSVLSTFPASPQVVGQIAGDAHHLFVQTTNEVLESTDQGVHWHSIGGPGNYQDTRMTTRAGYLYVGSIDGQLWQYRYDPTLPAMGVFAVNADTIAFPPMSCSAVTRSLSFTSTTVCSECIDTIHIARVTLSGSPFFHIVRMPDTVTARVADSILVSHDPAITATDTATLTITYDQYGQRSTKTIVLTGASSPIVSERLDYQTDTKQQTSHTSAGVAVHTQLSFGNALSQTFGLRTVTFTLNWTDNLAKLSAQAVAPWTIQSESDATHSATFTLAAPQHQIIADEPLITVDWKPYVSPDTMGALTATGMVLNSDDPNFELCAVTLPQTSAAIAVSIERQCGDSTIRGFMESKSLVSILSTTPDPLLKSSSKMIAELQVNAGAACTVSVSVIDALGAIVRPAEARTLASGTNTVPVNFTGLSAGVYTISLGAGMPSARIVVE